MRKNKVMELDEAINMFIKDGIDIGIGGTLTYNMPSAVSREIINRGFSELTIYAFIASYPIDILIGAGCVERIISPFITFGELGLAPSYRRYVEGGKLEVIEIDEAFWGFSLRAGSASLPFIPLAEGYDTDIPNVNPLYKRVISPYDGKEYITVPPLKPTLSIIHCQLADKYGNGIHLGNIGTDKLLAKASKHIILTCDRLIPNEEIIERNREVTIPSFLVDAVVPIRFCCHPLGSDMLYNRDIDHLTEYIKSAKTEDGFNKYLEKYVMGRSHEEYLDMVGEDKLKRLVVHDE